MRTDVVELNILNRAPSALPLLETPEDKPAASSYLTTLTRAAGQTAFHTLHFTRIALVTQALTGRWLYQFFIELDRFDAAPSRREQQSWLGWPIIGAACVTAGAAELVNHYKLTERPLQDLIFAAFSSSMLYFILDNAAGGDSADSIPLWSFIVTSLFVPVASGFLINSVIPDSGKKLILKPSQLRDEDFPIYPDASTAEKVLNIVSGAGFGSALSVLFWVYNREQHSETVDAEITQTLATGAAATLCGFMGYHLTKHPKRSHGLIALAKAAKDAGLAYASLSGIAFHVLMYAKECADRPCWDSDLSENLTNVLIPIAATIGLYSAATTLYQYDLRHISNRDFIDKVTHPKETLRGIYNSATQGISDCFSSLFCCRSSSGDDNHDVEEGTPLNPLNPNFYSGRSNNPTT